MKESKFCKWYFLIYPLLGLVVGIVIVKDLLFSTSLYGSNRKSEIFSQSRKSLARPSEREKIRQEEERKRKEEEKRRKKEEEARRKEESEKNIKEMERILRKYL